MNSKSLFPCLASLAVLLAGCCTESKYGEFAPAMPAAPSSVAFDGYGPAMGHHDGYQMAYEWQRKNPEAVKKATEPKVLAEFVKSDLAADELLWKIGTSYAGDPVVLTQIAAVTQLVMCPKCDKAPAGRKVWVAALQRRRASTTDGYVRTFCD